MTGLLWKKQPEEFMLQLSLIHISGVSTESDIPDFRSADGLYRQKYKYSPEQIVSHSFFVQNPEGFYEFYKEKMMFLDAKPNAAHRKLAELEAAGKLTAVITQNIDCLLYTSHRMHIFFIMLHGNHQIKSYDSIRCQFSCFFIFRFHRS